MELASLYKKIHKIDNLHYIALESVINRITDIYRGRPKNYHQMYNMKLDLEEEIESRRLNKYFQLELTSDHPYTVGIKVHEINPFNKPEECVILKPKECYEWS